MRILRSVVIRTAAVVGTVAAPRVTNPTEWGLGSWASDIVAHLAYSVVAAAAYEAFAE